ncbi:J domain-containing protein [Xanthobacter versatilis]|uniref:J domain-containing protein n=1 Tax=Xanthobacter autotrophicus (strain ATCC BAA-1158 / Py2) TaxID=78245 RepID=UPI003726E6FA
MTATAFPLSWPPGWPRTPGAKQVEGKFRFKRTRWDNSRSPFWTFAEARDALLEEARKLGSRSIVLSTNFPLGRDGAPVEGKRRPDDQGVAIYFELQGRALVMAAIGFVRAEENMRSLALALEGLRQVERHGGGVMMERAFDGFAALPAPAAARPWRDVLGFNAGCRPVTAEMIEAAYRSAMKRAHPDRGGSHEAAAELNAAREAALKEVARG